MHSVVIMTVGNWSNSEIIATKSLSFDYNINLSSINGSVKAKSLSFKSCPVGP